MTVLHLVRHAPYEGQGRFLAGRASGIGLGADGRRKAEGLAVRLAHEPLAAVWASPLQRTRETAAAVAERHGLPVAVAEEANEVDFGAWTGLRFDELDRDPRWHLWNEARSGARAPGGETIVEVQARLVRLVERLRAEHRDGAVALVSHGDVIRAGLAYFLGVPIDLFLRIEVAPASISTVELFDRGPRVRAMNVVEPE